MEKIFKRLSVTIIFFVIICCLINFYALYDFSNKISYEKKSDVKSDDILDRFILQYYGENSSQEFLNTWNPELKFRMPLPSDLSLEEKSIYDKLLKDFLARNLILCTNQIFDLPSSSYPKLLMPSPINLDEEITKLNNMTYSEKEKLQFSLLNNDLENKTSFLDIIQDALSEKNVVLTVDRNLLTKIDLLNDKLIIMPPESSYFFKIKIEKDNKNIILAFTDFNLPLKKTQESFMAYNAYGKFP